VTHIEINAPLRPDELAALPAMLLEADSAKR